jgi:hypothetical protein
MKVRIHFFENENNPNEGSHETFEVVALPRVGEGIAVRMVKGEVELFEVVAVKWRRSLEGDEDELHPHIIAVRRKSGTGGNDAS